MDDQELKQKIDALEKKLDAIFISTEKTRKYFLWVLVASLVVFILPLVGLLFAVPSLTSMYGDMSALGL